VKQIEVTIMGQSYVLGCPEGGEQSLLDAVASVDREMTTIRDAGKIKARERIAVLAAINLAFQLAERVTLVASHDEAAPLRPDLDALLSRVDAALRDDGRLL